MDILSGVASVIAVIQISGAVIDICYQYRTGVKNAPKSIIRLMNEVRGIRTVLEELETALEEGRSSEVARPASLEEVTKSDGLLSQCYEELENLKRVLEPRQGWRAIGQAMKWPLTEKDIEKTLQRLHRLNSLFALALAGDYK
jgi:hypothetical protein